MFYKVSLRLILLLFVVKAPALGIEDLAKGTGAVQDLLEDQKQMAMLVGLHYVQCVKTGCSSGDTGKGDKDTTNKQADKGESTPNEDEVKSPQFCIPGPPALCTIANSSVTAIAIKEFFDARKKEKQVKNIKDSINESSHSNENLVPEFCSDNICSQFSALVGAPNLDIASQNDVCMDADGKNLCIGISANGKPKITINKKTLDSEKISAFAKKIKSSPSHAALVDNLQNNSDLNSNSLLPEENKSFATQREEVDKELLNKKKEDSKKRYSTGSGFSTRSNRSRNSRNKNNDFAQVKKNNKNSRKPANSIRLGKSRLGTIQENIFTMAHRRYQKLKSRQEFY